MLVAAVWWISPRPCRFGRNRLRTVPHPLHASRARAAHRAPRAVSPRAQEASTAAATEVIAQLQALQEGGEAAAEGFEDGEDEAAVSDLSRGRGLSSEDSVHAHGEAATAAGRPPAEPASSAWDEVASMAGSDAPSDAASHPRTLLSLFFQQHPHLGSLTYVELDDLGPETISPGERFQMGVLVNGAVLTSARARNKKAASTAAAEEACQILRQRLSGEVPEAALLVL